MATVNGTSGNDFIHVAGDGIVVVGSYLENNTATDGSDTIYSGGGGSDIIYAGDGTDSIHFGSDLDSSDSIHGGAGSDTLYIDDQVSVTFGASSLFGIESIVLAAFPVPLNTLGADNLTMDDANVADGQSLTVNAGALTSDIRFKFDGSAETDGYFAITGGLGSDFITGGEGNDVIDLSNGGNDTVSSGGGYDLFFFGNALTANDRVTGSPGTGGIIQLAGLSYASGLTFSATTLTRISDLLLTAGANYALTTDDGNVAAGETLTVDATALGLPNTLNFDGSAETDGSFRILGGSGNDHLTGGAGADEFVLFDNFSTNLGLYAGGGYDVVSGGGGNDVFRGVTFRAQVDGGAGFDTIYATGFYIVGGGAGSFINVATYGASSMTSIERIVADDHVQVTLDDANVAAGKVMQVWGDAIFDGSAETDGHFHFSHLAGGHWTGGALADTFTVGNLDDVRVTGGGGNDLFTLTVNFSAYGTINGGAGKDLLKINCDLSAGVAVNATMLRNVETVKLAGGHSYMLSTADGVVAAGETLTVNGAALAAADTFRFDGSAETDGFFTLTGGAGNDHLTGGALADTIAGGKGQDHLRGGKGADTLTGDAGADVFVFHQLSDSGRTAASRDIVMDFKHGVDHIDLSGIDAIHGGGTANDAFTFIGTAGFTAAGQVRVTQSGSDTIVRLSVDADPTPEASIMLHGVTATDLTAGDFIL